MSESKILSLQVRLVQIVGPDNLISDPEACADYGHDETEDLVFPPDLVLKPGSTLEISEILKLANELEIPVTVRGAGTGLSGSCLPVKGGWVLSTERLNKILEIDEKNHQATVEPGVITEVLQNEVARRHLFYPVDPASKGSCTIGGNIAQSSGGPKALKYGTTRENVLNLEVVWPNGDVSWTGANVLKYSTGYNLTQLMIGSEGTLGVVTKAVLKLRPLPTHNVLLLAPFRYIEQACEAVSALFAAGLSPSAIEFMERNAIDFSARFTQTNLPFGPEMEALLLIELDGFEAEQLQKEAEEVYQVLEQFETGELLFAESEAEKDELWQLRRKAHYAVKHHSVYKEEDTVVPRNALPALVRKIKELEKKYGFTAVCYGHAGDGNLHVNILKSGLSDEVWNGILHEGIVELFQTVVALGGTISGEHGIGLVQKPFLPLALSPSNLAFMKGIKQVFDPKGILNPGKIF